MKFVDTRLPKLCHAKPGDIVRLENGLHMVCAPTRIREGNTNKLIWEDA